MCINSWLIERIQRYSTHINATYAIVPAIDALDILTIDIIIAAHFVLLLSGFSAEMIHKLPAIRIIKPDQSPVPDIKIQCLDDIEIAMIPQIIVRSPNPACVIP